MPKFRITLERHKTKVEVATVEFEAANKGEAVSQAHLYVKWSDWSPIYKSEEVETTGEAEEIKENVDAVPA